MANGIPFLFSSAVKPLSVNISVKPKQLISEGEYNLTCIVNGSVPDTEIKWTQNNRPFKRGQVRRSDSQRKDHGN